MPIIARTLLASPRKSSSPYMAYWRRPWWQKLWIIRKLVLSTSGMEKDIGIEGPPSFGLALIMFSSCPSGVSAIQHSLLSFTQGMARGAF